MQRPVVAVIYIVANALLAVHIFHGAYSMFQSLGISNPAYNRLRKGFAATVAAVILIGNVSFPIAVLTHVIKLSPAIK
jgi:succinate dehydrogenase / fumarate reductase cytochrome b subunit